MKMRKKRAVLAGLAAVCLIGMTGSLAAGCGKKDAVSEKTGQEHLTGESKDSVVVTMPKTSEPEAGFDPAYGWGAGEHTHEPRKMWRLHTIIAGMKALWQTLRC